MELLGAVKTESSIHQDSSIGINIKKARLAAGLSQEQLSAKLQVLGCDISRGTLAKIEVGLRHLKATELKALTQALSIDYNFIFQEEER